MTGTKGPRNAIEHALVASEGSALTVAGLPPRIVRWWEATGVEAIEHTLARSGGNVCEAGRLLGMPRSTLYRRLRRYGLR